MQLRLVEADRGPQSVNGSNIMIKTTNDEIAGNFEANVLDLSTSNGRIEVNALLHSDPRHGQSSASPKSVNAYAHASFLS